MVTRMVLVCVGIGMMSCIACAQNPANAPATRGDLDALALRIEGSISQWQKDADARVTKLEEQLKAANERITAMSDVQEANREAIAQIAKKDKDGKSYIQLDASHEPTRAAVLGVLEASIPEYGTVVIENIMPNDQLIAVNDRTYTVLAGTKLPVQVPVGEFRVRLPGRQAEVRNVGLPRYTASVVIRPQTSTPGTIQWIGTPYGVNYIYQ